MSYLYLWFPVLGTSPVCHMFMAVISSLSLYTSSGFSPAGHQSLIKWMWRLLHVHLQQGLRNNSHQSLMLHLSSFLCTVFCLEPDWPLRWKYVQLSSILSSSCQCVNMSWLNIRDVSDEDEEGLALQALLPVVLWCKCAFISYVPDGCQVPPAASSNNLTTEGRLWSNKVWRDHFHAFI